MYLSYLGSLQSSNNFSVWNLLAASDRQPSAVDTANDLIFIICRKMSVYNLLSIVFAAGAGGIGFKSRLV